MIIENQHQISRSTGYNRYPNTFLSCKKYWDKIPHEKLNILSFGCATGEECFTLLKYFPSSTIVGVDIDKNVINICNNKNTDRNISFMCTDYENLKLKAPFDMIFCMSVLCRYGTDKKDYYFSDFDGALTELDTLLSKNGLLIIFNSNYRFSDSSIYYKYKVLHNNIFDITDVPKLDRNNNLLYLNSGYEDCIFVKQHDI